MDYQIVLASSSPYRRELLTKLGLDFICLSPNIDESPLEQESAEQLVERLAIAKAQAAAKDQPNALIIAADQAAVLDGKILGKPGSHQAATKQLQQASGKQVLFLTSIVLLNTSNNHLQHDVVPYSVVFRDLEDDEIEAYLHKEQPYDCAGSFKSEGLGISLFKRLEGDDPNSLIGLPIIKLVDMLHQEGIRLF